MKKQIILFSVAIASLSLMASGIITLNDSEPRHLNLDVFNDCASVALDPPAYPNFFYDVGTRFMLKVTKETLNKAQSLEDFIPDHCHGIVSYESVSVIILDDWRPTDIQADGENSNLTSDQIALLRSADYSTNFLVKAYYEEKDAYTGRLQKNYMTPHITIVPEKQAEYAEGKEALIQYLKTNSLAATSIAEEGKIQPGKLYFTVTAEGYVSDVILSETSGYPSIDAHMVKLMSQCPGKWVPAENIDGEKVDQKLVFSFGNIGC